MASAGHTASEAVAAALERETEALSEFVALLTEEQKHLGAGDSEAVVALTSRKEAAAQRLAALGEQREAALVAGYGAAGRAGIERWLAEAGQAGDLWQRLLALAAEARNLNQTNGKLIALHLQHNQKALDALLRAGDRAMTYGPDGQQRLGGGRRILGSA